MRGQIPVSNSQAAAMNAGCWDSLLSLWDLAEAIPVISENRLPLLTENNLQTFLFYLDPPLIKVICRTPTPHPFLLLRTPLLFGTGEYRYHILVVTCLMNLEFLLHSFLVVFQSLYFSLFEFKRINNYFGMSSHGYLQYWLIFSFNFFFTKPLWLVLFILPTRVGVESISISFCSIIFEYYSISFSYINLINSPRIILIEFMVNNIYFIENIKYFFKYIIFWAPFFLHLVILLSVDVD